MTKRPPQRAVDRIRPSRDQWRVRMRAPHALPPTRRHSDALAIGVGKQTSHATNIESMTPVRIAPKMKINITATQKGTVETLDRPFLSLKWAFTDDRPFHM